MRPVGIVTVARSDFGLLRPVLQEMDRRPTLRARLFEPFKIEVIIEVRKTVVRAHFAQRSEWSRHYHPTLILFGNMLGTINFFFAGATPSDSSKLLHVLARMAKGCSCLWQGSQSQRTFNGLE